MQSAAATHILTAAEADVQTGRVRPMPAHLLFNTWLGLIHHYVANRDLFAASGRTVMAVHGPILVDHYINLLST
jgi:hypothetical protein